MLCPPFGGVMKNTLLCAALVILTRGLAFGQATEKVLWSFAALGDGATPRGQLVFDHQGNLYGTTYGGGANNYGTVYALSPSANGWSETILYSFCSLPSCADGVNPWGGVILDRAGNLYGTTIEGGASDAGTVFELSRPSHRGGNWTLTTLWSFDVGDGWAPVASLTWDASGNL